MKLYKSIMAFIVINYVIFGAFLYRFQDYFLYHPTPEIPNHGLSERIFRTDDGVDLKALVLNPGNENAILYFGGNAEAVGYNANSFEAALPEQSVYLINYRGYGGSGGQPSEADLYRDALTVYDALRRQHGRIAVIGRSLGSGVATYLAAEREVEKLVLVTPFDSIENVAQKKFPYFPMSWILNDRYHSIERVEKIKAKVLVVLAEYDQIIERWSSDNLIAAFPKGQVEVQVIADSDHNSISGHARYYRLIGGFLSSKSTK